ncbi:hypothetical protein N2152v2_010900 [Parachlorella kessleri]
MTDGKVFLVTGGGRGIGFQLVTDLLAKGSTVIATVRNVDSCSQLKQLASQNADRLHIVKLDVNHPSTFAGTAEEIKKAGYDHLDVVINNAGILGELRAYEDVTEKELQELSFRWPACLGTSFLLSRKTAALLLGDSTNTIGPFLFTQQLKKAGLIGGESGTVVANISSVLGSIGHEQFPGYPGYDYRAFKAALNMLSKHTDIALAKDNVTCFVIHPGYVRTAMNKGGGHIEVEESAKGILDVLESDKDKHGTFYSYDGQPLPW